MEMLMILVAILAATVVVVALFAHGISTDSGLSFMLGFFGAIAVLVVSCSYVVAGWSWFASEYKAEIINAEYGTNYSQAQVFWASDVIDTVRELDRKRIEVNGDLFREEVDNGRLNRE